MALRAHPPSACPAASARAGPAPLCGPVCGTFKERADAKQAVSTAAAPGPGAPSPFPAQRTPPTSPAALAVARGCGRHRPGQCQGAARLASDPRPPSPRGPGAPEGQDPIRSEIPQAAPPEGRCGVATLTSCSHPPCCTPLRACGQQQLDEHLSGSRVNPQHSCPGSATLVFVPAAVSSLTQRGPATRAPRYNWTFSLMRT